MNAKLTTRHDWLRVAITTPNKTKLSLTVGRSGEGCSGTAPAPIMKKALASFAMLMDKGDGTVGDKMDRLHSLATQATDIDSFVDSIPTIM